MATQTGSLDLRAVKQTYIKTVAKAQPIYKRTNSNSAPSAPTSKITANTDQGTSGNWTLCHMSRIYASNLAYKYLWTCNQFIAPDGTFLGCSDVVPDEGTVSINGADIVAGTVTADQMAANSITIGNMDSSTAAMIPWTSDTESVPYLFRKSGGSISHDFAAEYDKLVGGTVAWNQLRTDTYTTVTNYEGVTTSYDITTHKFCIENISRTALYNSGSSRGSISSETPIGGHKYIVLSDVNEVGVGIMVYAGALQLNFVNVNSIFALSAERNDYTYFGLQINNTYDFVTAHPIGNKFYFTLNVIDLTQMFGSTIADYIYSLETANAGVGVAWFRKLFPNDYYAYDAGTLKSVEGLSAHKTHSKNLYRLSATSVDNSANGLRLTYDSGNQVISVSGTNTKSSAYSLVNGGDTAMPMSPLPAGTLFTVSTEILSGSTTGLYLQVNYNRTGGSQGALCTLNLANGQNTYTFPSDFKSIHHPFIGVYGTATSVNCKFKAQLELGATKTDWTPYDGHTYALDSTLTLRGIPKLDSSNNLYYDGDTYASDGTVTRKYGVVDLGTLAWRKDSNSIKSYFICSQEIANLKPSSGNTIVQPILCSRYPTQTWTNALDKASYDKVICAGWGSRSYVAIADSTYADSDATTFKSAMSGVMLVYELATPTTESASPYTSPQAADPLGTEEYVSTSIVPVGHETTYANAAQAGGALVAADTASRVATNYITAIDENGIKVHAADNVNSNYAKIDADGMEVYKGGTSVAFYGDTARIGKSNAPHVDITTSSISMSDGARTVYEVASSTQNTFRSIYNMPFYDGMNNYDDTINLGRTVSSWTSIVLKYKVDSTEYTQTFNTLPDNAGSNKYYFLCNQVGPEITVELGRGDTATASEVITIVSVEFNFTTAQPVVESTLGAYAETSASGALRIGNGTSSLPSDLSNAMLVDWGGNTRTAGDIYVHCDKDSGGGVPLSKHISISDAYTYSSGSDYLYIGASQIGYVVVLEIVFNKAAAVTSGGNVFDLLLNEAHLPAPTSEGVSGLAYASKYPIGLYLGFLSDTWKLNVRNLSASSTSTNLGVRGTLTYIWDGIHYTDGN